MLVSVVVPCYNLAAHLPGALDSLIRQTYRDLEIIVINDGSPDNCGGIAEEWAKADDRIRVVHQENQGLCRSLNNGFEMAKGDAFIILSPDDRLQHTAIGTMADTMRRTNVDLVNVDMLVDGRPVGTHPLDLERLKHGNCFGYAALFKRWLFKATDGFKEMNPSWEDYEFWVHCAKLGAKGARIAQPLFIYQPNPHGRSAEAQGQDRVLRGKLEGYHQDVFGRGRGVVAVVIPLYDQEEFVSEAAQSALEQVYPHVQVIVVDDGSPGDAHAALSGLPVHLLRQENRGLSGARNAGIRAAMREFGAQYFIPLDADDTISPNFIERTMAVMGEKQYVYTDLSFIGDAHHDYDVFDFDCAELYKRHLHACTCLFEMDVWQTVVQRRGYGYDEAMRDGFEDWEFAMACVEAGWCGYRLRERLFGYRWHKNGSMRTEALKIKDELGKYIRDKHPKETFSMAKGCCPSSGRYTRGGAVNVKNLGNVPVGEALKVTYTGPKQGVMRKIAGSTIYSYCATQRVFFIDARHVHLFSAGPFKIERVTAQVAPRAEPQLVQVAPPPLPPRPVAPPAPAPVAQKAKERAAAMNQAAETVSHLLKDDLTKIRGVGPATAKRLVRAGFTTFASLVEANAVELAQVLGVSVQKAQEMVNAAADLADPL